LPLYTEQDAREALKRFQALPFDKEHVPWPGWSWRFARAGHILGAASVRVAWPGASILFSGDLGRRDDLLMRPPEAPQPADHVVVESTYGDRVHRDVDTLSALAEVVNRTAARGGMLVIPSFAVGRAQTLLHCIHLLKQARRIPDMPVYLNSPMAADATRLYLHHAEEHRLSAEECAAMRREVTIVNTIEDSKRLNQLSFPSIIVSASGMATGGRVLHHLADALPDPKNTVLFVGFQSEGTRGRQLVDGAKETKIHGRIIPVNATIVRLDGMSAHADQSEILRWLRGFTRPPKATYLVHGEVTAMEALKTQIVSGLQWRVEIPQMHESVEVLA